QFGQVRSIFSRSGLVLEVTVVVRFIVLLFLPEILGQVAQNRRRIGGTSFESGDATGPAPAGAALNADDDVLVEKAAVLQKANGRFRGEFIRSKFAHADQIAKAFGLLRLGHFQKWIETMNLTT